MRVMTQARWDLFCRVIDNYGDIGVCWRLARQLAASGTPVRLWIDDASALRWMAPEGPPPGLSVHPWAEAAQASDCGAVVIEAFGCELPEDFVAPDGPPAAGAGLDQSGIPQRRKLCGA